MLRLYFEAGSYSISRVENETEYPQGVLRKGWSTFRQAPALDTVARVYNSKGKLYCQAFLDTKDVYNSVGRPINGPGVRKWDIEEISLNSSEVILPR